MKVLRMGGFFLARDTGITIDLLKHKVMLVLEIQWAYSNSYTSSSFPRHCLMIGCFISGTEEIRES